MKQEKLINQTDITTLRNGSYDDMVDSEGKSVISIIEKKDALRVSAEFPLSAQRVSNKSNLRLRDSFKAS